MSCCHETGGGKFDRDKEREGEPRPAAREGLFARLQAMLYSRGIFPGKLWDRWHGFCTQACGRVTPHPSVSVTEQLVNGCCLRRVLSVSPTGWKGRRRKEEEGVRGGRGELGSPTHTHNAVQLHLARTQIRHHANIDDSLMNPLPNRYVTVTTLWRILH